MHEDPTNLCDTQAHIYAFDKSTVHRYTHGHTRTIFFSFLNEQPDKTAK